MEMREAIADAGRTAFCNLLAVDAAAARYFGEAVEDVPVVGGPLSLPANAFSNAYSAVCGTLPTPETLNPGTQEPTGCNAVQYRTRVFYNRFVGGVQETVNFLDNNTYTGPVSDTIITPTSPGGGIGDSFSFDIVVPAGQFRILSSPFTDAGTTATVESFRYERVDGQPDNCGPAPPPPPLTPSERTTNINVDIDGTVVPVDFTLNAPIIGVNGDLDIPITVVNNDFNYDIRIKAKSGDVEFNFGGGGKGDPCCPETDEDPPTTQIIRGVVVTVNSAQPNRYFNEIPITTAAPIYGPYVGLLRFTRQSGGQTIYSEDIPIKTSPQDVVCPWENGATGFVLDDQVDASLTGRPYFAKVTEQPSSE